MGTQDIRAIATTPDQKTVWVGTWSSGLHGLKQQTELETTSKVSEPILAITAGTSRCWAVGLDGFYQHKDSDWLQVISAKKLLVRGWLQAVAQAVTDYVWLGTSAGLLVYKPDAEQLTTIGGAVSSADVRSLLVIPKRKSQLLCVGTTQGLYVGNSDNWEAVTDLENRTITALAWMAMPAVGGLGQIWGYSPSESG